MATDRGQRCHVEGQVEGLALPPTPPAGQEPEPWGETRVVGRALPRVDAFARVSGRAVYPSDLSLPGMLYAAILGCPHPHARVRGVAAGAARALAGVRAVLTPADPAARLAWKYDEVASELFPAECRFEGEAVAAVAADTPYLAADALRALEVDYEVLPFTSDFTAALAPEAPAVQPGGNRAGAPVEYARGDVAQGFAEADLVLERIYATAAEIHTPLEPHGCVAWWEGDTLNLHESTQGVFIVREAVAEVLGLPLEKVRVIGHYLGGGFGAKLQSGKYAVLAALLAKETGRPVKLFLTREETFLSVGNRPPSQLRIKAGVKRDGSLTALEMTGSGSGGAFPASGVFLVDWVVRDLYTCPHVRTSLQEVFINGGPSRAFRAPGHPQGAWALEQMMDELARELDMDPVDLRLANVPAVSQARGGLPYSVTGLAECLTQGAAEFGWAAAREATARQPREATLRRGVGMAAAVWIAGSGFLPSTVKVSQLADGGVELNMGASDIGTGTKTIMAMVVAEDLGLLPGEVRLVWADTGLTEYTRASGGSKTVPTEAPAVRAACLELKRALTALAARELGAPEEEVCYLGASLQVGDDAAQSVSAARLAARAPGGRVTGVGERGPNPPEVAICPFAAQFCEVEVNTLTGEVRVLRFLGATDAGRVMNRLTYDNQVGGGIVMGLGLGLTEERVLDHGQTGKLVNRNWHDYKLPTMLDAAGELVNVPIEIIDTKANTVGTKGLGEPVTIPTAPALANAICDACGVRARETPANPVRLAALLAAREEE
ncbi:MAG: xanthine dehydrogenase family protein molybdopterin-binding subunit [Deltaproteobacteria bacterium]|nr:xanthine dehydrogenase family protein molybdopterin-binding subunit [Deltaproteobacteria bacterium]